MERLRDRDTLIVMTAGCRRDSFDPIEELPLIDQDHGPRPTQAHAATTTRRLTGKLTLSPVEHKHLFRTVLILDAVVRGKDKSGASLRAWRNLRNQLLKSEVEAPGRFPELRGLILGNKHGVQIDIDRLAVELARLWSSLSERQYTSEVVEQALEQYLPIARELPSSILVREAFEKARPFLRA